MISSNPQFRRPTVAKLFGTAAVLCLCTLLLVAVEPRWETNDDVAMAMVSGGYGIASHASADLFFSTALWGRLVQLAPEIADLGRYSVATYSALLLALVAILLVTVGEAGWLAALALLALVFPKALLIPQFTINAGLLTVAGLLCVMAAQRTGRVVLLGPAVLLLWLGFAVRPEEAVLVAAVGTPLLLLRGLVRPRHLAIAGLSLAVAVCTSIVVDRGAYQADAWRPFQDLNKVRASFTDYDAASRLLARPDLMARYGLSKNDVEMVFVWFAEDAALTDPARLRQIVQDLGTTDRDRAMKLNTTSDAITVLASPPLRWLVAAGGALLLLASTWQLAAAWLLALSAFALTGYLGRPGVLHIYVPVLVLIIAGALFQRPRWRWLHSPQMRGPALASVIAAGAIGHSIWLSNVLSGTSRDQSAVLSEVRMLPAEPIVIWGEYFPFEVTYAPLRRQSELPRASLYGLGAFSWAPFSVAFTERLAGRGMIERLRSKDGVLVIAHAGNIERLAIYCRERLKSELKTLGQTPYSFGTLRRVSCSAPDQLPRS